MAGIAMRNAAAAAVIAIALSGCCAIGPNSTGPPACPTSQPVVAAPAAPTYPNPIFIPVADPQCAWERVVDVVGDYFRIGHEEPARIVGNVPTEGRLETVAEISPTTFEPWRRDTIDPDQRLENTLQSMRRRAVVRVTPAPGGHWVDVTVLKELENLVSPEHATAGAATFRYDSSFTRVINPAADQQIAKAWISQGRDASLEQAIIGDLLSRCGQVGGRN
jgi:hypothetical protein